MSVSSASVSPTFTAPAQQTRHARHSRSAGGSGSTTAAQSKSDETVEQLAEQGDPTAIAELRAERQQPRATQGEAKPGVLPAAERTRASEPDKGETVEEYA